MCMCMAGDGLRVLLVPVLMFLTVTLAVSSGDEDLHSDEVNRSHQALRGHQIWQVNGEASSLRSRLQFLQNYEGLDVLNSDGLVRVKAHQRDKMNEDLKSHNLNYEVIVQDLQTHLQDHDRAERIQKRSTRSASTCTKSDCSAPITDAWMTLEEMEWYLLQLNQTFGPRISVKSIGKSFEGRDIWMVHIDSSRCSTTSATKAIWIEGGIHAREWISPIVSLYIIDILKRQCDLSRNLEFYIVPMSNPDGYQHTINHDRFWRKNRNSNSGNNCFGVDLNRNWDFKWGVGASSSLCSEVYKGTSPFSEPETKALSDEMKKVANLQLVIALHSFGQTLLYPWGWTSEPPPDIEALKTLGNIFSSKASEINGNTYTVGNSASGIYFASGATDDWAKGVIKAKYSYTLELPNKSSFVLPATKILPTCLEVVHGLKAIFKQIVDE